MADAPTKRRALGRGLSALLPSSPLGATPPPTPRPAPGTRQFFQANIEELHPDPEQPRRNFDDAELDELAASLRNYGLIQPVAVRARQDGGYFIIAGERRWRAAQRAGLHAIPVVVHKVSSKDAFERALVENVQRSDLNPIETALAYARLIDEFGYSQEQVAERVGKDRSSVANNVRLLKLPASVRQMVEDKQLSMGHARALLAAKDVTQMETIARKVVGQSLSVRATEKLLRQRGSTKTRAPAPSRKSASIRDLEERLTRAVGAPVEITDRGKSGGDLHIRYADLDHLDRILERLL